MIKLTLIIAENCFTCSRVETQLKHFVEMRNGLVLSIISLKDFNRRGISIVPALLVNGELFAYGDIDENKLLSKINNKN
jgi:hypothetical protein